MFGAVKESCAPRADLLGPELAQEAPKGKHTEEVVVMTLAPLDPHGQIFVTSE